MSLEHWIKIRVRIHEDPAVIRMAIALDKSENEIVGALVKLWAWATDNLVDGNASSVTESWLDRYTGVTGVTKVLCEVGWLVKESNGYSFPNWERHLSNGAKERGEVAKRVRKHRAGNASVTGGALQVRYQQTEEQKEEDIKTNRQAPPPTNDPPPATNPPAVCPFVFSFRDDVEAHCQKRLAGLTRNKRPMFDAGAVRSISRNIRCTPERMEWAIAAFKQTIEKRKPPKNAAAYIRSLIEGDSGPPPQVYPNRKESA